MVVRSELVYHEEYRVQTARVARGTVSITERPSLEFYNICVYITFN